jgi:hypothetical protein
MAFSGACGTTESLHEDRYNAVQDQFPLLARAGLLQPLRFRYFAPQTAVYKARALTLLNKLPMAKYTYAVIYY